jgi:hypothetical protein
MGSGDQSGTWGTTTNTNLGTLIEAAIAGYVSVTPGSDADYTLTVANGATDESRNMVVNLTTGLWTTARNVIVPAASKTYIFKNSSSYAATVKTASGTGVTIASGLTSLVFCDGTNVVEGITRFNGETVTTTGNVLVGRTSLTSYNSGVKGSALNTNGQGIFEIDYANSPGMTLNVFNCGSNNANQFQFYRNNIAAGLIATDSSAQTYYTASSDYRLKSSAQPLTGSGTFIDSLQPKSWVWIVNGNRGAGFIAHEAAQIIPSSVFGEKDAIDDKGNPVYQSMSAASSEMIANIVAELQSLRARVAALEAK